ncbi:zinc finger protein GAI-ASSOCIATED FACTOR 1-like [Ipomoea triloba]|uniref:zinc finger protein GAI-ASSOCIATED FACTOR 1-like n=1 Tax=Ipomoea triloba TaxID=35885 RepID=UPI00125D78FA|nr:zinc finger protein GAI-ASSOCIATED FACTOR 1-like [Ipomoea triloba]
MSNITGEDGSFSSGNTGEEVHQQQQQQQKHLQAPNSTPPATVTPTNSNGSTSQQQQQQPPAKKKRNLPGTPDPNAEVVALSPTTLMATNRFVCEICNKGFQRDQNLQLHRRGHNLPWKLRQRTTAEVRKRVYICPEPTCVHHNPARALGDLTGIKKHYSRKHGEKKWKCDKCSKKYAVQSDWKAHQKTCGTREYKCDCGTIFSRRDSFITHRAFCDALAEENNKVNQAGGLMDPNNVNLQPQIPELMSANTAMGLSEFNNFDPKNPLKSLPQDLVPIPFKSINMAAGAGMFATSSGNLFGSPRSIATSSSGLQLSSNTPSPGFNGSSVVPMSATALLQKAAQMGATASNSINSPMMQKSFTTSMAGTDHRTSTPPPYGALEQQSSITPAFENFPTPPEGGFSAAMNDIAIYTGMLMNTTTTTNEQNPPAEQNPMTVDFLGVGGSRPPPAPAAGTSMHQQQQRLEMEAMNQQRMQAMSHPAFHHQQQHMLHGNSALWDV